MKKIKFIFSNPNMEDIEKLIAIDENKSLRIAAIEVYNNYLEHNIDVKDKVNFVPLPLNTPIEISMNRKNKKELRYLYFYLNEQKEVIFLDRYAVLMRDWTISELNMLINKGYLDADLTTLYISFPKGLGASPGVDISIRLATEVGKKIAPVIIKMIFGKFRKKLYLRKLKKVSKIWVEKHGVRTARTLRLYIDERGKWELSNLKSDLSIDEQTAVYLLTSLGYELEGNYWCKSYSDEAINNRRNWEENDERFS